MAYILIVIGYFLLYRIHPAYFSGPDGWRMILSAIIIVTYVTVKGPRK